MGLLSDCRETEHSVLAMPVKAEIKQEECDDDVLCAIKEVEEKSRLEHGCKTETNTSPTFSWEGEEYHLMEIKDERESDRKEYGHDDSSPTSKFLCDLYGEAFLWVCSFRFTTHLNTHTHTHTHTHQHPASS